MSAESDIRPPRPARAQAGPVASEPMPRAARLRHALARSRGLLAFGAFLLACLWSVIGWQIHREHDQALQAGGVNLANLARAFAEHTAKSIEGADQAIRFIRNEYRQHPRDLDIAGYLRDKQIIGDDYHLISVIGPDGMVSFSSRPFDRVDLSDREHFKVHAQGKADTLFVSKPVRGRVSHKLSIQLTRRVDLADGRFGGVVVVSLSPEYLAAFYKDVDLGAHGAITLVGVDGIVRARASRDGTAGAQDVSSSPLFQRALREKSGLAVGTSSIDHVERLFAFRALDEYKLIVMTGMGTDDLLASVRANTRTYLGVGAALSLIILGFSAGLVRQGMQRLALMDALELSNAKANAANEMKSRFLASVSHELRTPLNGVLGYAELVREVAADEDSRQYGQIIHQSAEHLLAMVNTILDLAKVDSGRLATQRATLAVAPLLEELHARNVVHAHERGLGLECTLADDAPRELTSDRTRVLQILHNLVDNALKFSTAGVVRVHAYGAPGQLVIEVRDPGRGMTEARLGTVFDRFQPHGVDGVHEGQGAGLGLPLAKELVDLLGGTIAIASTPDVGTCVTVRLPTSTTRTPSEALEHA